MSIWSCVRSTACAFLVACSMSVPALAESTAPVKIAVFDFELDDFSAVGSLTGGFQNEQDSLKLASAETRQLLAQSGRYTLVETETADAEALKSHRLRFCKGCEAAIAKDLGAEQSMLCLIKRISKLDYTVIFQIRDAQTGSIISTLQSELRLGADYSWSRGAAWLVKNRVLEN